MAQPSVTTGFYGNSIFLVEVEKVRPNPYQPRKEFDEAKLRDLADSIRQYGILQPLVVTRHEIEKDGGGLVVYYELIAGERRLRAAKLLGLPQVPVLIRADADNDREKLELAIIENLQREDLNSIDRARAFSRLTTEFNLKHHEIAAKVGKSREFVSNTLRLLGLPELMQQALVDKTISEGHTRPLLMLDTKKEEQMVLFKEILDRRLTVREAESVARRIAQDRARPRHVLDPETIQLERELMEALGTRVQVERKEKGGKIVIDFFTQEDLRSIVGMLHKEEEQKKQSIVSSPESLVVADAETSAVPEIDPSTPVDLNDKPKIETEKEENQEDLYSIKNFSL
jgi:ParB family chromosome partitioning protein